MAKKKTVASAAELLLAKLAGGKKVSRKGLPKRTGRRKQQHAHYYAVTMPARKLRHLLRSNGLDAARAWADAHGALHVLRQLREDS